MLVVAMKNHIYLPYKIEEKDDPKNHVHDNVLDQLLFAMAALVTYQNQKKEIKKKSKIQKIEDRIYESKKRMIKVLILSVSYLVKQLLMLILIYNRYEINVRIGEVPFFLMAGKVCASYALTPPYFHKNQ